MRISYSQTTITPSLSAPVFLAGFQQNRTASSIHDDLYCRVLVIEQDSKVLVLAALDLLGLSRVYWNAIESRIIDKIPEVRLVGACTHTHHGPDTIGLWGPDFTTTGVNPDYLTWLQEQVINTVLNAAHAQRISVQLLCGSTHVPGVAKNARDPEIIDDELAVLQFVGVSSGRPLVTLVDFPCHPEVLGEGNQHITADYPGCLRREIETQTGAPCIFFAGALGGMMTPDVKDHSFQEAQEMGRRLSEAAIQVISGHQMFSIQEDHLTLEYTCREIRIHLTNPGFQAAIHAGLLPDILDEDGDMPTEVNLIQIGPAWLATVPGELLPKLGILAKESLRTAGAQVAVVVGLANDEIGYILPKEDFIFPQDPYHPASHYEETMSVSPEAGPQVLQAIRQIVSTKL